MSLLKVKDIYKTYSMGKVCVNALNGISLEINTGEFIAIIGKSGSGKSTLLKILGGLDEPTRGDLYYQNEKIQGTKARDTFRTTSVSFVFQSYELVSVLNVEDNIIMPLAINGQKIEADRIQKLMKELDINHLKNRMPDTLSGGERQRVAIARAVASENKILLADEPTGNLDTENTEKVMDIFERLNKNFNQTIVIVTHNLTLADMTIRKIVIQDGKIANEDK